jgi:hypothetical protein
MRPSLMPDMVASLKIMREQRKNKPILSNAALYQCDSCADSGDGPCPRDANPPNCKYYIPSKTT